MPLLTALAEPLQDSLYGQAPPGESLTAYVFPFDDPATVYTQTGITSPDGSYIVDLQPSVDLHRQDSGYILIEPQPDRRLYLYFIAPLLRAQVGSGVISGLIPPQTMVMITQTNTSGEFIALYSAYGSSGGDFVIASDTFLLNSGDRLLAAAEGQVFSMTLPLLSASTDLPAGVISGVAEPEANLEVRRYPGPLYDWPLYDPSLGEFWDLTPAQAVTAIASPAGDYSASLDLQADDYAAVIQTLPDENQAYARTATTSIYVPLDDASGNELSYLMWVQIDRVRTPVTVTVQGPSGYYKDWDVFSTGNDGVFAYYTFQSGVAIDSGDTLRVTSPHGEELEMLIPQLTAEADTRSAVVSGIAPPDARLTVLVYNAYPIYPLSTPLGAGSISCDGGGGYPYPSVTQVVTASASGEYLADFSSGWTFDTLTHGQVILNDPPGQHIARRWDGRNCPPALAGAQVGGNRIQVYADYACLDATIRLRGAGGGVKAESPLMDSSGDYSGWEVSLYDEAYRPVPIRPGDLIEVDTQGQRTQTPVPDLSVQINPATSIVSGQAPAGERVSIQRRWSDVYALETLAVVTATQSGAFQVDLSGAYTYETGDRIYAALLDSPKLFYAISVLPRLEVELYSYEVHGWLPPLTSYTLTFTRAVTSTQRVGFASSDGRFWVSLHDAFFRPLPVNPGSQINVWTPSGSLDLTIPDLSAHLDTQAGQLSGAALPGASLRVVLRNTDENDYSFHERTWEITASAQGEYSLDFSELLPIGDLTGALIYLHPDGHRVSLALFSPRLRVQLGSECVGGIQTMRGAPANIRLTGADGSETIPITSWEGFHVCFSRPVQPGDQLVLSDELGVQVSYRVPNLIAYHDFARQALIGHAPPNSDLEVTFHAEDSQELTRIPWQEADGSFGIDTSDLSLNQWIPGRVTHTDWQGNQTSLDFSIGGNQAFLPCVLLAAP